MPSKYDDWYLNHIHPAGQDGFKSDENIATEESLERSDNIYLQRHPFCDADFYCDSCNTTFVSKASEKHYCKCGSTFLTTQIKLRKIKSNYANIWE